MSSVLRKIFLLGPVIIVIVASIVTNFHPTPDAFYKGDIFSRIFVYFTFFTDISNVSVAIWFFLLYKKWTRSSFYRAARTTALIAITLTALIHNLLLIRYTAHVDFVSMVLSDLFHFIIPLWTIAVWLVYDRYRDMTWVSLRWAFGVFWFYVAYVLIFGALTGFYPYGDLVNPNSISHSRVLLRVLIMFAFYATIGIIYYFIERLFFRKYR